MGIDDLSAAATPQKDTTPLSERSLIWWIFFMPGKVFLWFAYMFPTGVTASFASARQRNVPLVQLAYTLVIYGVVIVFGFLIYMWSHNGRPEEEPAARAPVMRQAQPRTNDPAQQTLPIEAAKVPAPPSEASAENAPGELAVQARMSPQYTACMKDALATVDMLDCIGAETAKQDALLNATYKGVMSLLEAEEKTKLRDKQREWIKMRDARCEQEASEYEGGSFAGVAHASCYLQQEVQRLIELEQLKH